VSQRPAGPVEWTSAMHQAQQILDTLPAEDPKDVARRRADLVAATTRHLSMPQRDLAVELRRVVAENDGNVTAAARATGLAVTTVRRLLNRPTGEVTAGVASAVVSTARGYARPAGTRHPRAVRNVMHGARRVDSTSAARS